MCFKQLSHFRPDSAAREVRRRGDTSSFQHTVHMTGALKDKGR
eukprot:CAMPEP_0197909538 /NCGR_PEP_ID=MMETSP1439-20131203/69085_1 /TAXON_ID=66791 /ORGANISM="Gonyaulax spinifera, Strain CCMP409" /LENGTH=42 /DNA_ID= /DNA_START= /DNA_END= /DNA_ORIENTATION=